MGTGTGLGKAMCAWALLLSVVAAGAGGDVGTPATAALLESGDQAVTVVCLGDSVTGVYYHTGGVRAYPEMLEIALRRLHPKAAVSVVNAGISGNTTVDALARMDKDVLRHKPQLITVMFALNDMTRVPLEDFEANLATIIARGRGIGAEMMLCTPNSTYDTAGRPIPKLEQYVAAIRAVAGREKVALADCYQAYEAVRAADPLEWALLMSEDIHPNMDGHKLDAEVIARAIGGRDVSLDDVGPPVPCIPKTLALLDAGEPIRVLAMPPYDSLIAPALGRLDADVQVEVEPWPVEGQSLAQIEAASKPVREMKHDLVVIAVPATADAESAEQYVRSYSWVLNLSLSFGLQEWDCIAIPPSTAQAEPAKAQGDRERLAKRLIKAQDIGMIERRPGEDAPLGELVAGWFQSQAKGNCMGTQPQPTALLDSCLDYGRSFVNTTGPSNAPYFWVESRCRIADPATGETAEYLQCGSCKSENTFAESDLFQDPNYDFIPVFSERDCVIFRRHAEATAGSRQVAPRDIWGAPAPCLRTFDGRVLTSAQAIGEALKAAKPLVGQTELRDEETGRTAIIEYPIKTLNWRPGEELWQVDTGPVLLPDLSVPAEEWSESLQLAFIAYRTFDWADFVVEQPTPIIRDESEVATVHHYSGLVHKATRNVLLALDED